MSPSGLEGVPDWSEAEKALLALPARERVAVRRAVALGRELPDVRLAQIAVAYARYTQRVPDHAPNRWLGLAIVGVRRGWALIGMAMLVALLLHETLFLLGLAVILVVGLAVNARTLLRHAARAEELNLAFLRRTP